MTAKIVPNLLRRPTRIEPAPEPVAAPDPDLGVEDNNDSLDTGSSSSDDTAQEPAKSVPRKSPTPPRTKRVADPNMERVSWRIRKDLLVRTNVYLASRLHLSREDVINAALEMFLKAKKA